MPAAACYLSRCLSGSIRFVVLMYCCSAVIYGRLCLFLIFRLFWAVPPLVACFLVFCREWFGHADVVSVVRFQVGICTSGCRRVPDVIIIPYFAGERKIFYMKSSYKTSCEFCEFRHAPFVRCCCFVISML